MDIRKLIDIVAESSAGATVAGGIAGNGLGFASGGIGEKPRKRVEESDDNQDYESEEDTADTEDTESEAPPSNPTKEFKNAPKTETVASNYGAPKAPKTEKESADDPQGTPAMPEVIEYGNWENSALVTSNNTKKKRSGVKSEKGSVYTHKLDRNVKEDKKEPVAESKPGLWANIHAKQERIKGGSGEKMRKPGSKGAPTAKNFRDAATEGVMENHDTEELANAVYAEFERIYPNLARKANERTVHTAIMDVLNYGGDSNPSALAQDVARAVRRDQQQGVTEGAVTPPKPRNFVAKNAKMGGAGQHRDKKKAQKQGDAKHKNKQMDVAEGQLNELSNDTLASYKKKAAADASKADKSGNFKRGDKRFGGIVKATLKQGENDAKKVNEAELSEEQLRKRLKSELEDLFKQGKNRELGKHPESREIQRKQIKEAAASYDFETGITNPDFTAQQQGELDPDAEIDEIIDVGVNYTVSGSHRPATWGYHGGEPAEHPEIDEYAVYDLRTGKEITNLDAKAQREVEEAIWADAESGADDYDDYDRWSRATEEINMTPTFEFYWLYRGYPPGSKIC